MLDDDLTRASMSDHDRTAAESGVWTPRLGRRRTWREWRADRIRRRRERAAAEYWGSHTLKTYEPPAD